VSDKHFTHLHLHTEFSLLDGAISLDSLINYGKQHQLKALAMTDHGNIFGAVKFFQKCKAAKIKPILGIETYLTEDAKIRDAQNKYYHLVLLVQNETGYKNLCKLISFAYQDGFYFKPRIDYNILAQHSEGLIALTACLGGHIPQLLMQNQTAELELYLDKYLQIFGRERFFLEIQPEDQLDQKILNQKLYQLARERDIQLVATSDSHYVNLADREAHEIMLSIQTRSKLDDPDRFTFGDCRAYMRTPAEMLELFKEHEQAVWNSGKIADMCNFDFETGKLFFPKFEIPAEHTQDSFFKYMCETGLAKLLAEQRIPVDQLTQYQARLALEIDLIISMGFVGYFLVVGDFIQWAKRNQIPVGPGRGSAAGSLVAWALEITNIDPLKYNLLFERFLNPERVTMPDIDIDFCIEGRERVIQYVRDRYGHDKVCQIITFGTMMAKGVIKDVARVLGLPFEDANLLTDLISDQLKITLAEAVEKEPKLQELIQQNPKVKKIFEIAYKLEGLTRHASKHAAGIVISPEKIDDVLPVYVPAKSNELVTQYAMTELESLGYLKIDMLGLKNLTLVDRVIKTIAQLHKIKINVDLLPLDDPKTFALIQAGKTSGVFQLESDGLKEVLLRLKPDNFEDIIAVNALYRPGPLGSGMVDDFIARRHGRQKIEYQFPELTEILAETYGVIVYQEQVIKIASTIAGYSLGEADILRRAMGKKKAEVMAEQKQIFVEKSVARGFDQRKSGSLFDLMAYFAGYGFNKSHSAAYALIAYQTAYLKANYPAEFMACLISLEATHPEKMSFYLAETKNMGLELLPPDINRSQTDFTVILNNNNNLETKKNTNTDTSNTDNSTSSSAKILYGLHGIKNLGLAALENIIAEQAKGPFKDLLDFCTRIDLRTVNKRVLENLNFAGAFDRLPGYRSQKQAELAKIMELAIATKEVRRTGQMQLFSGPSSPSQDGTFEFYVYQPLVEWSMQEKLKYEKEIIGFYLSAHPLDHYQKYLRWLNITPFDQILAQYQNQKLAVEPIVTGLGIKKSLRIINTKKGDKMCFLQLEDYQSQAEIIIFPKLYQKVADLIESNHVFIVQGNLDLGSLQKCKIKAINLIPVEQFWEHKQLVKHMSLDIAPEKLELTNLKDLRDLLRVGKTDLVLKFSENQKNLQLNSLHNILVTEELLQTLEQQNFSFELRI
jgi:DNA polymerase-3 subunit alpha